MSTKILNSWWTRDQTGKSVGFVLIENDVGKRSIRCGVTVGDNWKDDQQRILAFGGKLAYNDLRSMLDQLTGTNNFK